MDQRYYRSHTNDLLWPKIIKLIVEFMWFHLYFSNFFLLSKRGECKIIEKAKLAQKAGYSGLIVYNDKSDTIIHVTGNDSDIDQIKKIIPIPKNKNRSIDTLFSISVSIVKLLKTLQVKIYQIRGYIVLTDRYPIENIIDDLPQWKNSYSKKIEKKLNKIFKEPNKIFLLHADEETLQARKPESYKDPLKNKLSIQMDLIKSLQFKKNLNSVSLIENSSGKNNNEFKIIKEILEMIANDNWISWSSVKW